MKPLPLTDFANQVKRIADDRGILHKDLLASAGLGPSYLYKWGAGLIRRQPGYREVAQMADTLGVPVELLIYGTGADTVSIPREMFDRMIALGREMESYDTPKPLTCNMIEE